MCKVVNFLLKHFRSIYNYSFRQTDEIMYLTHIMCYIMNIAGFMLWTSYNEQIPFYKSLKISPHFWQQWMKMRMMMKWQNLMTMFSSIVFFCYIRLLYPKFCWYILDSLKCISSSEVNSFRCRLVCYRVGSTVIHSRTSTWLTNRCVNKIRQYYSKAVEKPDWDHSQET